MCGAGAGTAALPRPSGGRRQGSERPRGQSVLGGGRGRAALLRRLGVLLIFCVGPCQLLQVSCQLSLRAIYYSVVVPLRAACSRCEPRRRVGARHRGARGQSLLRGPPSRRPRLKCLIFAAPRPPHRARWGQAALCSGAPLAASPLRCASASGSRGLGLACCLCQRAGSGPRACRARWPACAWCARPAARQGARPLASRARQRGRGTEKRGAHAPRWSSRGSLASAFVRPPKACLGRSAAMHFSAGRHVRPVHLMRPEARIIFWGSLCWLRTARAAQQARAAEGARSRPGVAGQHWLSSGRQLS